MTQRFPLLSALFVLSLTACHPSAADASPPAPTPAASAPLTRASRPATPPSPPTPPTPTPTATPPTATPTPTPTPPTATAASTSTPAPTPISNSIVERARLEVARGVTYDPAWFAIPYPNGDPAPDVGVCTDVVIRSLRTTGIDLQSRVHEDILRRPAAYTTVKKPDRNIDHRRVTPMLTYLRAHAKELPKALDAASLASWEPGDIVVWAFRPCPGCNPDHVGIVSDRKGPRGVPLVLHNIGPRPTEDDRLDEWTILGHFRMKSPKS